MPALLAGLADLIDRYDLFIVDQWGCMHDGFAAHPGARAFLVRLREAGRRVVLVSNSSRPAAPSVAILRELGFEDDLYDAMLTAGELARRWLEARYATGEVRLAYSVLSEPGPTSLLAQMGFPVTDDPAVADVLVASGTTTAPDAAFDDALRAGIAAGRPLLCLNPDRKSVQPDGTFVRCPGAIADRYAALGGDVRVWGKPGREIYEAAFAAAGAWSRGVGIGDSLEHDIAGARGAGLDSVLVTRGIHWVDVAETPTAMPDPERLRRLVEEAGVEPTFVVPMLRS